MNNNTTLWIRKTTHKRLKKTCLKDQTYDDLINELLDFKEKNDILYN